MKCKLTLACIMACLFLSLRAQQNSLPVYHPEIGTEASSADGELKLRLIGKHQQFSMLEEGYDTDIHSPKSVNIHPNGRKYYVNSLEGCLTVAYDMQTHEKLAVIHHDFTQADSALWAPPSGFYEFTHYEASNVFTGKPVESCFSHAGRYLWVPYYRRIFDINAQDPSAIAVIDTRTDSIIRMFETGPLPKMIACSHDGRTIAVSHWGNNTIGLINIESEKPEDWHHEKMLVVDYILPLNFSLTETADRDNGSGYALRGTVFTEDDRYLLVGCMGAGGGIAVVDLRSGLYLGRVLGMAANVRHLVICGPYLYLSINGAGQVQRIRMSDFTASVQQMKASGKKTCQLRGWQTCQVGKGARTLELSPSGRYAFVACNNVSRLCVVDTRTMKQVAEIEVDSYPVGLDISEDGRYVIVTSQGRDKDGGNAVNIYEVEYATPEPLSALGRLASDEEQGGLAQSDTIGSDSLTVSQKNNSNTGASLSHLAPFVLVPFLLLLLFLFFRREQKGRSE